MRQRWTPNKMKELINRVDESNKLNYKMIRYSNVVDRSKENTNVNKHLLRLYELVKTLPKDKVVVELGVNRGETTIALLAAVNDTGGHLYSNDVQNCNDLGENLEDYRDGLQKYNPNWTFLLGDDLVIGKEWRMPIDFLYIDTVHSYEQTIQELRIWGKWLKPNAIIALHDTDPNNVHPNWNGISYAEGGVLKAIYEYMEENRGMFSFINYPECYGLGVLSKGNLVKTVRHKPLFSNTGMKAKATFLFPVKRS
jgi:predicted O-methyltransferase YrrM